MTTADLHEILDDENKKLTAAELKQVIYELKQDCFKETAVLLDDYSNKRCGERHYIHTNAYYMGEQNAFQIALDLLEHLDNSKAKFYYDKCKSYGIENFYDKELEENANSKNTD